MHKLVCRLWLTDDPDVVFRGKRAGHSDTKNSLVVG
jgi:hypothetical protein